MAQIFPFDITAAKNSGESPDKLESLIAHNIDLAAMVRSIAESDAVLVLGQFESNPQGSVVHWTHKDPHGRHANGWLEHRGKRYQ